MGKKHLVNSAWTLKDTFPSFVLKLFFGYCQRLDLCGTWLFAVGRFTEILNSLILVFRGCMKTETTLRSSKVAPRWEPRTELGTSSGDIRATGQSKPAQINTHKVKTFALARRFPPLNARPWREGGGGGGTWETEGSDKQKHCCFSAFFQPDTDLRTWERPGTDLGSADGLSKPSGCVKLSAHLQQICGGQNKLDGILKIYLMVGPFKFTATGMQTKTEATVL